MDIKAATVDQIAIFKSAAARRYLERGIDPKLADQLFNAKMADIGQQMGVVQSPARERVAEKIAAAIRTVKSAKK